MDAAGDGNDDRVYANRTQDEPGDEQCPGFRAEGQRMGTFWASVIADKNKDSYSYPVKKTIL